MKTNTNKWFASVSFLKLSLVALGMFALLFVVAAGDEGPGSSTTGQPGSAELALTVGAVYPRALAALEEGEAASLPLLQHAGAKLAELTSFDPALGEAAQLFERLLARGDVAYLHVHFARHGCFACRVDRAEM